jgi:hypothetical protein
MLRELFAGVETEDCDIDPVTSVYDLGDDGTKLDRYFTSGISDQRMLHTSIMGEALPTATVALSGRGPGATRRTTGSGRP